MEHLNLYLFLLVIFQNVLILLTVFMIVQIVPKNTQFFQLTEN